MSLSLSSSKIHFCVSGLKKMSSISEYLFNILRETCPSKENKVHMVAFQIAFTANDGRGARLVAGNTTEAPNVASNLKDSRQRSHMILLINEPNDLKNQSNPPAWASWV
jgi:type 1 fimbria pilin